MKKDSYYIYKLTAPNGKVYIGQAKNLKKRLGQYSRYDCKRQTKLYNSLIKYEWKNFLSEVIEITIETNSDRREKFWIEYYNSVEKGLNCQYGGNKTKHLSKETRQKMSNLKKGKKIKPHSEEHRKNLSEAHIGKKHSDETRKKMSDAAKIKKLSKKQQKYFHF